MYHFSFCHGLDQNKGYHLDLEIRSVLVEAEIVAHDTDQWAYLLYDEDHNCPYFVLEDTYHEMSPLQKSQMFRMITPQGDHYMEKYLHYPDDE